MRRTGVIDIISPIVLDFHNFPAEINQLCSLQSGLGWHACREGNRRSPSNTGFTSLLQGVRDKTHVTDFFSIQLLHHILKDDLHVVEVG